MPRDIFELMRKALEEKAKKENFNPYEYKECPNGSKESYNVLKVIGNVNLVAGRFKTEKEVEKLSNKFLKISLP